jgi:hypothetical protein
MEKPKPLPVIRDLQGNVITPVDLPDPATVRWTPNKKCIVVRAVRGGLITIEEVLSRYGMREREFLIWEKGLKEDGISGLKVTHYQRRRKAKKDDEAHKAE